MSNKPKIGHRPGRCEPLAPAKCLHRHACLPASLPPPTLNFTRLPLAYPSCAPGPRRAPPPRWFRSCARTLRSCRVGSRRPPRVAHHRGLHRLALRRLRRGHNRDLGHARTVHGQGTVSVRSTHDRERPSNRTIRSTPGVQAGRRTMHFGASCCRLESARIQAVSGSRVCFSGRCSPPADPAPQWSLPRWAVQYARPSARASRGAG
jgi:hypothetical protein